LYFTQIMKSVTNENSTLINADFMLELEAAVRAFSLSNSTTDSSHLKSDEQIFSLVKDCMENTSEVLARFRKLEEDELFKTKYDRNAREEFLLALLFFIGHELGHLKEGESADFGAMFNSADDSKQDFSLAVTKMCRHLDEFNKYEFGLNGWGKVANKDSKVRKAEEKLRGKGNIDYINHTVWLEQENKADEIASEFISEYFAKAISTKGLEEKKLQFSYMCSMTSMGLYFWHRDLYHLYQKIKLPWPYQTQQLNLAMSRRENYIYASGLFDSFHRFVLLRTALAMQAFLNKLGYANEDGKLIPRRAVDTPLTEEDWIKWMQTENYKNYLVIAILMDTAVKFANFGCSMQWFNKNAEEKMIVINYESINTAVQRAKNIINS
jgi:hypothetical protein